MSEDEIAAGGVYRAKGRRYSHVVEAIEVADDAWVGELLQVRYTCRETGQKCKGGLLNFSARMSHLIPVP